MACREPLDNRPVVEAAGAAPASERDARRNCLAPAVGLMRGRGAGRLRFTAGSINPTNQLYYGDSGCVKGRPHGRGSDRGA